MGFVVPTPQGNVAFSIALGVLLLSVILHPIVKECFRRIRADRAWRAIQKNQAVDVTKYNIFSEALGDRGRWDTARLVTIMLALFHVATWGLELTLDIAIRTDGPVELLNRPPPIVTGGSNEWIVHENTEPGREGGTLSNFEGTLEEGYAKASYRIGGSILIGTTQVASWSSSPPSSAGLSLFYDAGSGQTVVMDLACLIPLRAGTLYVASDWGFTETKEWGVVTECESGPSVVEESSTGGSRGSISPENPPVIFLNSSDGYVHMVVEEESSYPSFLYSVWKAGGGGTTSSLGGRVEMDHVFYVSTVGRLVEAIVSGIVNGITTGGGCVDRVSQFSLDNETYSLHGNGRIGPFGEKPSLAYVERLDQVESIVEGVLVSNIGAVCSLVLIAVTVGSFLGCVCCLTRTPFDVYDRDAMLRAVSLPGEDGTRPRSAALKMIVRQMDDAQCGLIVSDDEVHRRWATLRKRFSSGSHTESAADVSNPTLRLTRSWSLPAPSTRVAPGDSEPRSFDGAYRAEESPSPAPRPPNVVRVLASPVPRQARSPFFAVELSGARPDNTSVSYTAQTPIPDDTCRGKILLLLGESSRAGASSPAIVPAAGTAPIDTISEDGGAARFTEECCDVYTPGSKVPSGSEKEAPVGKETPVEMAVAASLDGGDMAELGGAGADTMPLAVVSAE